MSAEAPQLEFPESASGGIWPWILALAAAVGLVVTVADRLERIPLSLHRQALAIVSAEGLERVEVAVDGRDLALAGEIDPTVDRRALSATLAAIDGVRRVHDDLAVVDPAERLDDARRRFRDALARIDTGSVAFEPGSASFTSSSDATLEALARLLRAQPAFRVRIAGHTDDTGGDVANLELSRRRAEAVAARLAAAGIDPDRMIAKGYGATQPVADNATDAGRAANRRIEISYID